MYSVSIISNEHLYKLKLLYRKTLPHNQIFFLVIFLVKYFPILSFSHGIIPNFLPENNIYTICSIIKGVVAITPNNSYNYIYLCIFIYFIIILLGIGISYVFFRVNFLSKTTDNKIYNIPNNKLNMSKQLKILFRIICIGFFLIIFFFQHIQEILYYEIFIIIYSTKNENIFLPQYISKFERDKNYVIFVMNILFIAILMILMYFFMKLSSNGTITQTYGFRSSMSPVCLFTSIILFSLQGLYSTTFFFTDQNRRDLNYMVICYILMAILFINAVSNFKQTNYSSHCLVDYFLRFMNNFCLVSSVMEILMYHFYPQTQKNDQIFYLLKLFFDLFNGVMLTWLFSLIQKTFAIKSVIKNFFNSNRTFQFENLFNFYLLLKNCETFHEKYFFIFQLLQLHRQRCSLETCECRKHDRFLNSNFDKSKFADAIQVFLSISEDKITNAIINFSKENNKTSMSKLLILHIDYLFSIKENIPLTLYLSQYYLIQHRKQLNFNDAYLIYEMNYFVITKYNSQYTELSFIKKNMIIEKIQKIILFLCDKMEKLFYYKSLKNANSKMYFTCEDILFPLIQYVQKNNELIKLINKYRNQDIFEHSIELKYTIIYFIKLFNVNLPKTTLHKLYHGKEYYPSYEEINSNNLENNVLKSNYMILFLKSDNRFIIKYLSLEIAEMLSYTKNEIMDRDFNETMIPKAISNYHNIYMKQFILSGNYNFCRNTFLVNKVLQLIPVRINCKVLPTKNTLYCLFVKIETLDSDTYTQSHLLLDMNYQLWGMSKSFEEQFIFSLDMLKLIKLNFCDFFGINKESINNYFKEIKIQASKKVNDELNSVSTNASMIEHSKLSKILALPTVRKDELCYYRNIDYDFFNMKENTTKIKYRNRNDRFVKLEIVPKEKIINSIIKLRRNIDELGLEREWKMRLNELYYRFTSQTLSNINYNKINPLNVYSNYRKTVTPLFHKINYGNFYIKFHLKKIGDIIYFVTTISEITEDSTSFKNHKNKQYLLSNSTDSLTYINRSNATLSQIDTFDNKTLISQTQQSLMPVSTYQTKNSRGFIFSNHQSNFKNNKQQNDTSTIKDNIVNNSEMNLLGQTFNSSGLDLANGTFNTLNNDIYNKNITTTQNSNNAGNHPLLFTLKNSPLRKIGNTTSALITNPTNTNKYIYNFNNNGSTSNCYLSLVTINKKARQIFFYKIIIMVSLFIVFTLNIVNLILNNISTHFSLNLFYINAYTFLLTNDVYYGTLACINTCLIKDGVQEGEIEGLYLKTQQSSEDLIDHFHSLIYYTNLIIEKNQIREIYDILNKENEYKYVINNWMEKSKVSSLLEEIYSLHYNLKTFNQNKNLCRMSEIFFAQKFKDFAYNNEKNMTPTNEEKFIYYISSNVISTISTRLEELMKKVNAILHQNNGKDNNNSLILNLSIVVSTLILYFSCVLIIQTSRFLFKGKMIYLFSQQENEELFYEDIQKFKKLLQCFSKAQCYDYTHFKVSIHNSIYCNNMMLLAPVSPVKSAEIQKSTGKSLLPGRERRRTRTKKKGGVYEGNVDPKQKEIISTSDVADSNENKIIVTNKDFRERAEPKFAFNSLIILSITFIIFIIIEISSIFVSLNAHVDLTIENHFATNFLSRGPKINELILYSIISVVMDDVGYIQRDPSLYDEYILSNQYKIKLDIESNSIFRSFGDSNYAYLYYQLYIIRTNIALFINDSKMNSYLKSTSQKEFLFEEDENYCIYASLDYIQFYYGTKLTEDSQLFDEWNSLVQECRNVGSGINLSGYRMGLDLMLEQLSTNYYNFKLSSSSSRQEEFLANLDIGIIVRNVLNVLRTLHIANSYSSIEDVEESYSSSRDTKILFSIVSICYSSGFILVMIVVMIIKFDFYISIINEIGNIFEKSIQNYN